MFKSITIADAGGDDLKVTVEGQKVVISDWDDSTLVTVDADTWANLQEVVDLAFRQIDPLHTGKEKK